MAARSALRRVVARMLLALGPLLSVSGCADPLIGGTVGGVTLATLLGGRSPSHEIEQVYYLGVFDPDDQVPPSLYRLTVRGQASFISTLNFASGWVPASMIDSLGTRIQFKEKGTELEFKTGDPGQTATLKTGRRLVMFGPEGFREAPADHRLVIVMGSSPEKYFESVEQVLGAVAAAKQEQSLTAQDKVRSIREELLKLADERVRLTELKATFVAEPK